MVRITVKDRVRDRVRGRIRVRDRVRDSVRDRVRFRDRRSEPDRRSEAINFGANLDRRSEPNSVLKLFRFCLLAEVIQLYRLQWLSVIWQVLTH